MDNITHNNPESQPTDLAPLSVIRTETVFSKLPIHNLSKKGRVNIQITKMNGQGEIELHWEVSHSDRYGPPRQLAYKLDTLVINRRIDELGRPLPKLIRLGSLREIGKELGIPTNPQKIKNALLQNVGALITAKFTYKAKDGSERWIEFVNTRYGVVFTGGELPDGKKADAVHIILNDPYREVLNNAPVRPLDYDYLKELPPAAQRFYETISYRIFAAIKYKHRHAKLLYSDYCIFSAQHRYHDWEHVRKQMYKVHRPHLKSGYIRKVSYEATTDSEGKSDWIMYYTPGPKAKAEYRAFNSKRLIEGEAANVGTEKNQPEISREQIRQRLVLSENEGPEPLKDSTALQAEELVKYFYERFHGVKEAHPTSKEIEQATGLIAQHGPDQARYIVDFSHRAVQETNYKPQTFGGILQYTSRALADYEEKTRAEEGRRKVELQRQEEERREREQRERERQELDQFYQSLTPEERERVDKEVMENLKANPLIRRRLRERGDQAFDSPVVRAVLGEERQKILHQLRTR